MNHTQYALTPHGAMNKNYRGVTLIELLVVISIIMILTVVVLPTMKPAAESRRIREAARVVNVFLGTARNQSIATGKPCGVMFQRENADNRFCSVLYQVEVPPLYGGDYETSRITLSNTGGNNWSVAFIRWHPTEKEWQDDASSMARWPMLVSDGDIIRFNYQGYRYKISFPDPADKLKIRLTSTIGSEVVLSQSVLSKGLSFQVFRAPVKTAAEPLQLPTGVAIDLSVSGGASDVMSDDDHRIVFSSDGSVHGCIEPLFLLLGQRERPAAPTTTPPAEDELPNWIVPTNLWLSISPQTGLIATSENYHIDPGSIADWGTPDLATARTYARESQSMGGR